MMHLWLQDYVVKIQIIVMIMFKFVLITRQAGVFLGKRHFPNPAETDVVLKNWSVNQTPATQKTILYS